MGLGATLLGAAFVPYLPLGSRLASVDVADTRYAGLVAAGLLVLVVAAMVLAIARRGIPAGDEQARVAGAAGGAVVPLLVGAVILVRSWSELVAPGVATPELDRLLLAGSAFALVGAPAAAWVILAPRSIDLTGGISNRWELLGLGVIVAAFALVVVIGILQAAPLSWDEAVYALLTRHWLHDTPTTGWGLHRPPALSVLSIGPMLVGSEEWLFRIFPLLSGIGLVAACWYLARGMNGPAAGLLAALAVAVVPTLQIDAGLLLNDVPSTALLVLLVALAWRAFERPGPVGWRILWLAPLAAAAFYVRYGAILPLVTIGLTILIVWPRQVAAAWTKLAATALLFGLLVLPHAVLATLKAGSPVGIFLLAQRGAAGAYPGAALVDYAAWLPSTLVGVLPAAIAVIGLLGAVHLIADAVVGREYRPSTRAAILLVVPAVLQIGVLGTFQLPQYRYLFLPMLLLVVAGSVVLVAVARRRDVLGRTLGLVILTAAIASFVTAGTGMPERAGSRVDRLDWIRAAGNDIARLSDGDCAILASDVPQLTWYSGCATYNFAAGRSANRDRLLVGEHRYLVLRSDGRFQPESPVVDAYLSRTSELPVATYRNDRGTRVASVYRFVRPR